MNTPRWLLPFTHGVDMRAIDYVVRMTESTGATLVAVSLISTPHRPRPEGARLEHIQQSKDFLEAVKWKAARYEITVERYEVFTVDVLQSITLLTRDLHCDSLVLVSREGKDALLPADEMKRLLEAPPTSLVLIRLPAHAKRAPARPLGSPLHSLLGTRFLSWLRRDKEDARSVQDTPEVEGPLRIRTEEHHRG